jgi:transcription-repair coupling factor (superfamily II helicase)
MESLQQFLSANPLNCFEVVKPDLKYPYVSGLNSESKSLLIADKFTKSPETTLIIASNQAAADQYYENLETLVGESSLSMFPALGLYPYEQAHASDMVREQRLEVYEQLFHQQKSIIITTWKALAEKLPAPEVLHQRIFSLEPGVEMSHPYLRKKLMGMGFREEPMVENVGEFAIRGGVVDLYPLHLENPIRLDFFGDGLESIRYFDIFSQRSLRAVPRVDVFPMDEWVAGSELYESGLLRLLEDAPESESVLKMLEEWEQFGLYQDILWQRSYFMQLENSLISYLNAEALVFIDEDTRGPQRFEERLQEYYSAHQKCLKNKTVVSKPEAMLWTFKELGEQCQQHRGVLFSRLDDGTAQSIRFNTEEQQRGSAGLSALETDFTDLKNKGYGIWLLSGNDGQAERLRRMVEGFPVDGVLTGRLRKGFVLHEARLAVFTDHQIFNRFSRHVRKHKHSGGVAIPDFESLKKGDLVIHQDHGLGRFAGLKRVLANGMQVDCVLLEYAGKDLLTLPVDSLNKLEKHLAREDSSTELQKLGGKYWEGVRKRAQRNVVKIAQELVELYAKRQVVKGYAFPPDSELNQEFAGTFDYEPTPDQKRAFADVNTDLEKSIPMDRLICGDVGFGKTEVAMRAAFKVVGAKKQVAVLVPTTILAAQHYENFLERFSGWPVNIELLNRYRSASEKKSVFDKLSKGLCDIVIGTHSLLSDKVDFADLGLMIIDEEQKFGVRQKEKLRELKLSVDCLSMSATPIPRTLHLSLSGARDISLITTPPRNRLPVETRVVRPDDPAIQESIQTELERGGQVFVVHDRVKSIYEIAERYEKLAPKARIAVGHGQLNEKELEQVMSAFMNREFDILVCTTIIESGIDIPNANTMIISNAHNFGVSQLYQLRGRVGRSGLKARTFLLLPENGNIAEESKKRLEALERFTDLGSGYQLAMRDLEIRGAGNLLGTEQSGFIAEIGYETYLRMVQQAVAELKGDAVLRDIQPRIEVPVDAYLPESWIEDGMQRIAAYQKISRIRSYQEVADLQVELVDRYGQIPKPAQMLLHLAGITHSARLMLAAKVQIEERLMLLQFVTGEYLPPKTMAGWATRSPVAIRFLNTTPLQAVFEYPKKALEEATRETDRILRVLNQE